MTFAEFSIGFTPLPSCNRGNRVDFPPGELLIHSQGNSHDTQRADLLLFAPFLGLIPLGLRPELGQCPIYAVTPLQFPVDHWESEPN